MTAAHLHRRAVLVVAGVAYALIFLGLVFFFNTDFILPGDTQPLSEKQKLVQRVSIEILNQNLGGAPPGTLEAAIYSAETRGAFDEFQGRYLAKWFKERKDAK